MKSNILKYRPFVLGPAGDILHSLSTSLYMALHTPDLVAALAFVSSLFTILRMTNAPVELVEAVIKKSQQ